MAVQEFTPLNPSFVRFGVGDTVNVLNAFRLPQVEEVRHTGVILRVQDRGALALPLYWIDGLRIARTARVLRLVRRAE